MPIEPSEVKKGAVFYDTGFKANVVVTKVEKRSNGTQVTWQIGEHPVPGAGSGSTSLEQFCKSHLPPSQSSKEQP